MSEVHVSPVQVPELNATVLYVSFASLVPSLDWIPEKEALVVVHNDTSWAPGREARDEVTHLFSAGNVGFGAAVNVGLERVKTRRVILCNTDTKLSMQHWQAMAEGRPEEVVVVPLRDPSGRPTAVVNRYPTPLVIFGNVYHLGRFLSRGGLLRSTVARAALGRWGRFHVAALTAAEGTWPLSECWVSGGVCSFDSDRLRAVHGMDESYFIYYEDVDVCHRLAQRYPDMVVRLAGTRAGVHMVGRETGRTEKRLIEQRYAESALRYAGDRSGVAWVLCCVAVRIRLAWLRRRAH